MQIPHSSRLLTLDIVLTFVNIWEVHIFWGHQHEHRAYTVQLNICLNHSNCHILKYIMRFFELYCFLSKFLWSMQSSNNMLKTSINNYVLYTVYICYFKLMSLQWLNDGNVTRTRICLVSIMDSIFFILAGSTVWKFVK